MDKSTFNELMNITKFLIFVEIVIVFKVFFSQICVSESLITNHIQFVCWVITTIYVHLNTTLHFYSPKNSSADIGIFSFAFTFHKHRKNQYTLFNCTRQLVLLEKFVEKKTRLVKNNFN